MHKKADILKQKLVDANRISQVDLLDYCDFKNNHGCDFFLKKQWSLLDQSEKNDIIDQFYLDDIKINYETQNYDLVLKAYIDKLKNYTQMHSVMPKQQADTLASSIIKSSSTSSSDIIFLIKLINSKFKFSFSCKNQFEIFIRLVEVN